MPVRSTEHRRLTPIAIRRSSVNTGDKGRFVISLADAISSPGLYERLQSAEKEYRNALPKWHKRISRIKDNRSGSVERWRLADDILAFENHLRTKWNIQPTNTLSAISLDLGISRCSLGYMFRLRERFSFAEVGALRFGWSKLQEILDIEDDDRMKQCVGLVSRNILKSDGDIRKFKKKANSLHKWRMVAPVHIR